MCFVLVVCNLIGEEDEDEEEDDDEGEGTDEGEDTDDDEEEEEAPPKKKAKKGSSFFALNPKELESPRRYILLYTCVFTKEGANS